MNIAPKKEVKTEKEYRSIPVDSYSGLKKICDSPYKYYQEVILGNKEDKISDDMIRGQVVDCYLTCPEEFDNKFVVAKAEVPGETTNNYKFVNELYKRTLWNTNDNGEVIKDFQELFSEAYMVVGIKKPGYEVFLEKFIGSDLESYYQELRESTSKQLIDLRLATVAEQIVKTLKEHQNTSELINAVTDHEVEVFTQYPIEFEYQGLELKCLLDKLIVDHQNKTIQPIDLKCTWEIDNFGYNYLKNKYYIQNGIYTLGVTQWMEDNSYIDYELKPFMFIAAHSSNHLAPIVFQTTEQDFFNAMNGFTVRGIKYMGVNECIKRLNYHISTSIWNASMEAQESSGKLPLNINYDK